MQITDPEHFCTDRVCGSRLACSRRSVSGAPAKERGKKPGECLEQASSRSVRNVGIVKPISPSDNKSKSPTNDMQFTDRELFCTYRI